MEARIRGENYKCKDSQGDIRLSISNSTSVSTLNTCMDVGRLPSGSQHKDRSGWENQNCSTGTGIPLQAALSKSWWWGVHPRWECHWLENSAVCRALEGEDMQFTGCWINGPLVQFHTRALRVSCTHYPHLELCNWFSPQFSPVFAHWADGLCILAQHRSSCNQFSPIMWPCTWWALAHTSWMKMLREISLCTISMLPLSHCLQISVKIKKNKSTNAIIPLFSLPTVILNAAERSTMCSRASIKACRKPGEF